MRFPEEPYRLTKKAALHRLLCLGDKCMREYYRRLERSRPIQPPPALVALPTDLFYDICNFLDAPDLLTLGSTCHALRAQARCFRTWLRLCQQKWRLPAGSRISGTNTVEELVRTYFLITSGPEDLETSRSAHLDFQQTSLSMTAPHTVQYLGDLPGLGNRAVRSVKPFPPISSPASLPTHLFSRFVRAMNCFRPPVHMNARFPSMAELVDPAWLAHPKRPFSTPWKRYDGSWDVFPRFVAYYEVTIQERPAGRPLPAQGTPNNCVAVGLASSDFPLEGLMPGWDSRSYAYHSDDGGIFHGKGLKVRYYGPEFGVGDVVGCGVDYLSGEIFFTLNGSYLGIAFTDVTGTLYPTVGIDSLCPIHLNFGEDPFRFDLAQYMACHGHMKALADFMEI